MPELHVHVHPAADAAAVGDEAAPEGVQLPPAPRQARLLPRPHRQAHRRLQHHTHCRTSSQSRYVGPHKQRTSTETLKHIFPEKELHGHISTGFLGPNTKHIVPNPLIYQSGFPSNFRIGWDE